MLYGGRGNDILRLSGAGEDNGRDYANCGAGFDIVFVEPHSDDEIEANCERVIVAH